MINDDWILKAENSTHLIYNCPFCIDRRGKEDDKGKLYLDKKSGKYFCFLCEAKGVDPERMFYEYFSEKEDKLKRISHLYDISLISKLNDVGYNYLKSRGLNDEQIERYNFASYKMYGIDTIFIPNSITDNKTNFYQLRYTSGSFRYLNCHTNSKPLFGRQSVLGRRKLGLCEGIFTSIGFERLNIDTVTLLGKFLTDSQKDELLKLVNDNKYEEVIVALDKDTMRESTELSKYLLDNLTCNISVIINKDENDYADQTIEELKKNYDKRIKITSSSLGLLPYLSSL